MAPSGRGDVSEPEGPSSQQPQIVTHQQDTLPSSTLSVLCYAWLVTSHSICTTAWANSAHYQLLGMTNK